MKTRTKHTSGVLFFCLLPLILSLASCSRQTPAKAAKPVAKALSVVSNELSRMPVVFSNSTVIALQTNTPRRRSSAVAHTPESQEAFQNRKKVVREERLAVIEKVREAVLARRQADLARCEVDVVRAELAIRAESDVASALGEAGKAAARMDNECGQKMQGFGELLKEKATLDAKLVMDSKNGAAADSAIMIETMTRCETLSAVLGERRRKAAIEIPEVAEAYRQLVEKESDYKHLIMGKESYRSAREKVDAVRSEIANLKVNEEK